MKHLVLQSGIWKLKNSNDIKAGEKDLTREILMTLVDQGILTTDDCCTYTLATSACATHAKTAYVDPNGNDTTAVFGDPMCPYLTIQAAVDAAIALTGTAETIKILPGIYVLTTPVDYSGASFLTFDISAGVRIQATTTSAFICPTANAPNVTFTGFGKISTTDASSFCIEGGSTPNLTVRNVTLENTEGGVIGGDWDELYLSNTLIECDTATDCITSSNATADVYAMNNISNSDHLATLNWIGQALVVGPLFVTA